MNIFYLHREPIIAATMLHDKHVVKMILESAQVMSTVYARYKQAAQYKPTHHNHPSVLWAGDSVAHYDWLARHATAMCAEYTVRYGKIHACAEVIQALYRSPTGLHESKWVDPPQCMPEEFKVEGDTVAAYRNYYLGAKVVQSKWTRRAVPLFVTQGEIKMAKSKKSVAAEVETQAAEVETQAVATPRSRGPKGTTEAAVIIVLSEVNPKRPGSRAFDTFTHYSSGMTVGEYVDAMTTAGIGDQATPALVYDAKHGFIEIEGYSVPGGVVEKAVKQPKAPKEPKTPKEPKAKKVKAEAGSTANTATTEQVEAETNQEVMD